MTFMLRKITSPFVGESFAFVILALTLSIFVSIPSVMSNMIGSGDLYRFFLTALFNTTLMVQLILIASLVIATKTIISFRHLSSVGRAPLS